MHQGRQGLGSMGTWSEAVSSRSQPSLWLFPHHPSVPSWKFPPISHSHPPLSHTARVLWRRRIPRRLGGGTWAQAHSQLTTAAMDSWVCPWSPARQSGAARWGGLENTASSSALGWQVGGRRFMLQAFCFGENCVDRQRSQLRKPRGADPLGTYVDTPLSCRDPSK